MAADLELSKIDERLLSLADSHSPREISRKLNDVLSPKNAADRITELLDTSDWLTDAQQDQLVVMKMRRVLAKLEQQFMDVDNAKLQLSYLKAIGDRLDKRRAATDVDLNTYNVNVGREMARAYDIALSYMKGALRDEIDAERWDGAAKEALHHASTELAKHAVDSDGNAVTDIAS